MDIQYLEEFQDARLAAAVRAGGLPLASALARLRSRWGLETHLREGTVHEVAVVEEAVAGATNPVAVALLLPAARTAPPPSVPLEPAIEARLRTAARRFAPPPDAGRGRAAAVQAGRDAGRQGG